MARDGRGESMSTTSCERCEDFAADALKVLSQRCAPDERHCSCVPHLRAEIDRLTAERVALLAPVDGINEDLGVLANMTCEDPKHNDLWCPTCEEYPTIRALAREAIRLRAELEEARLTLAAEIGDIKGALSTRWTTDGHNWYGARPDGGMDKIERWSNLTGDGTIKHCRGWTWVDRFGFEKDMGRFDLARAAMLSADAPE